MAFTSSELNGLEYLSDKAYADPSEAEWIDFVFDEDGNLKQPEKLEEEIYFTLINTSRETIKEGQ